MRKINFSAIKKWNKKWNYVIAVAIYLVLAIENGITGNYQAMAAYIIVILFIVLLYLQTDIIDDYEKIAKEQNKIIDKMFEEWKNDRLNELLKDKKN